MPDWNDRRHDVEYDSAVALRYHGRRMAFIDRVARLESATTVIFGSAAFAGVIAGWPTVAASAAMLSAALAAVSLAFALPEKARLHERLVRKWNRIRADIAMLDDNDERALRKIEVRRAKIDAESPGQLLALSTLCENEEKTVRRDPLLYQVGPVQRALANWFTLPGWRPILESDAV